MMRLTLSLLMNNVYATSWAAVTSPQLTTTYSQSTLLCQASKQPEITAINSLDVATLTSHQKAAITPASLGSISMTEPPEWVGVQTGAGKSCMRVVIKLLMADVPTMGELKQKHSQGW